MISYHDFLERELVAQTVKKKCNYEPQYNENCETIVHQFMEVETPVKIEVMSKAKDVIIDCGKPILCGYSKPDCYRKSSCEFVVKQCLHVEVPISYHVKADAFASYVKCKNGRDC